MGEEHVHHVGFYTISCAQAHIQSWHTWPAQKETMSCTRVYVRDGSCIGSIINSNGAMYCYTDSCSDILYRSRYPSKVRCWFIPRRNASIVCGASATYVDLAAAFFFEEDSKICDDCTLLLTSVICSLANHDI
jgi:hypothetical protein